MPKYRAVDLRTFQSHKLVPKNSDGKGNKWFLKQDIPFFPLNHLKYNQGFLFKIMQTHSMSNYYFYFVCRISNIILYIQLQWTNAFFILCHLWKGPYGNVRRSYKNHVAQLWMPLVLAKSRGNKFFKENYTRKVHTHVHEVAV